MIQIDSWLFFWQKLDKEQLSTLVQHRGSSVPLWLGLACGELRVYGDFRTLTQKIENLPDDLDGLLKVILNRLLREDETGCMEKVRSKQCYFNGSFMKLVHSLCGIPPNVTIFITIFLFWHFLLNSCLSISCCAWFIVPLVVCRSLRPGRCWEMRRQGRSCPC